MSLGFSLQPRIVGGLMAFWVMAGAFGVLPHATAATGAAISDVRITNVRDTTFTVSWITDGAASGRVNYGTSSALGETAYDKRGSSTSDDTHYVQITGLMPSTTYHVEVVSDATTQGGYSVTTGPTLLSLPGSDQVYGEVFKGDGSTPADGTIVYVTLTDADGSGSSGSAAPMSALVEGGSWYTNLGNARVGDLSAYFAYSASAGDDLGLLAQGAADGTASQTVDTADVDVSTAAPPLVLQGGAVYHIYLPLVKKPAACCGASSQGRSLESNQ